jgi:hypothetical protein
VLFGENFDRLPLGGASSLDGADGGPIGDWTAWTEAAPAAADV